MVVLLVVALEVALEVVASVVVRAHHLGHIHLRRSFRFHPYPWGALRRRRTAIMIPAPFPTLQRDLDSHRRLLLLALALVVLALVVLALPAFFDPLQPLLQMPTTTTLVGVGVRIPRWNLPSHRT